MEDPDDQTEAQRTARTGPEVADLIKRYYSQLTQGFGLPGGKILESNFAAATAVRLCKEDSNFFFDGEFHSFLVIFWH